MIVSVDNMGFYLDGRSPLIDRCRRSDRLPISIIEEGGSEDLHR